MDNQLNCIHVYIYMILSPTLTFSKHTVNIKSTVYGYVYMDMYVWHGRNISGVSAKLTVKNQRDS